MLERRGASLLPPNEVPSSTEKGGPYMNTSELLEEYKAVRLLELKHGQRDEEDVMEKEERIGEFIGHLEDYLLGNDWNVQEKGEKSRIYVNENDPKTYIELRYSITYPDMRTFFRIELKMKRKQFPLDKVMAEGEPVFSRI
jgi:hypothetical protein